MWPCGPPLKPILEHSEASKRPVSALLAREMCGGLPTEAERVQSRRVIWIEGLLEGE